MKKFILFILFSAIPFLGQAQVRINETDADQTSTDDAEFIELFSATPNTALDGYVLVLFNGSDDLSYDSYDLDGYTTDSNGFLILSNAGVTGQDIALSSLQNGPDAVAIYQDDASSFPNDTPPTTTNLIDALVYGTGDETATNLLSGLGETVQYNEDANGLKDVESIQYDAANATFCVGTPTPDVSNISCSGNAAVANIAALKSGTVGETYSLTGEVLLTYQQSYRNQKYIEDATAAILIDDVNGKITTTYTIGDGITNITGQLVETNGILKLVPQSDPGPPSSTGNTLTSQIVTMTELNSNLADYDAELVQVLETTVTVADNTITTWEGETIFQMTTSEGAFDFRTSFLDADYIDDPLPSNLVDITGIITRHDNDGDGSAEYFITSRSSTDITENLGVQNHNLVNFGLYPNPTHGAVYIDNPSGEMLLVEIYNLLGQKVRAESFSRETLKIVGLRSGIYLVQILQNGNGVTKKLVVR